MHFTINFMKQQRLPFYKLFKYATKFELFLIALGTLCSIIVGFAFVMWNVIYASLIVDMESIFDYKILEKYILYFAYLVFTKLIFVYLSNMLFNYVAIRQIYKIRSMYLKAILNQDISWHDINNTGDFTSRMTEDLMKFENGIGEKLPAFLIILAKQIISLIIMVALYWKFNLILLSFLPVIIMIIITFDCLSTSFTRKQTEAYAAAGRVAEEVITSIKTIFAFVGEHKEICQYTKQLKLAKIVNCKAGIFFGICSALLYCISFLYHGMQFWYGTTLLLDEHKNAIEQKTSDARKFFIAVYCGYQVVIPFSQFLNYMQVFSISRTAAFKIFTIIDSAPTINKSKHMGIEQSNIKGNIGFKNVEFCYPSRPNVKVLKGLNLNIHSGETVAIVGISGCGKSTCVQLLQRFYDTTSGNITIDGENIKNLNLTWLRNNIGMVSQEPVMFNTTIAENIRFGKIDASQEEIEQAAKMATAHSFISMLPEKYNTNIGERGTQLSGGQKQRIAIARALIRNPAILLLDEATSALDIKNELRLQSTLYSGNNTRTTIIIAHRLSTMRDVNKIIVISDGTVVEEGTHERLIALKSHYYKMVTTQILPSELIHAGTLNNHFNDEYTNEENSTFSEIKTCTSPIVPSKKFHEIDVRHLISLWSIIKGNNIIWSRLLCAIIFATISALCFSSFPILHGHTLECYTTVDDELLLKKVTEYSIYLGIISIVLGFTTFIRIYMFTIFGETLTMILRKDMFKTILKQNMTWFDSKENSVGALCAKLSNQAASVQNATSQTADIVIFSILIITLNVIMNFYYQWKLGIVISGSLVIVLFLMLMQQNVLKREDQQFQFAIRNSTKYAVEAIGNIRTVASLGFEETAHQLYFDALLSQKRILFQTVQLKAIFLSLAYSFNILGYVLRVYWGGHLVLNGTMKLDAFFITSSAHYIASEFLVGALAFVFNLQKGIISTEQIIKFLKLTPKPQGTYCNTTREYEKVTYNKLHFTYPTRNNATILRGIDLSIMQGKTVALIGPSGCGKTTIIQLLQRFYEPLSGSINIDEQNIITIPTSYLRKHLGMVSQEPCLFNRTIAENIAYGDNHRVVSEDQIIEAAKTANIHNFISGLPLGYQTGLGKSGLQLSGGQKQRIAIARALICNPKILLFDEATSALDTESEKIVQEALDKAKTGRTCIVIAHRLTTIENADVIYVLNNGNIIEAGTHSELLQRKQFYYDLYNLHLGK